MTTSLRLMMDAAFWDLNVSSTQNIEGVARAVPGEPGPLGLARAGRTIRPQQLSFLSYALPLGLIPTFAPTPIKDLGSFAIQSFLFAPNSENWWMALVGQIRPRKIISSIKKEVAVAIAMEDELDWIMVKDVAKHVAKHVGKHFLDKSLYALGFFSQISLTPDTSLLFNAEKHGDKIGRRTKAMLFHKLPHHDITVEAAWPELFVDSKGNYWEVPNSVSLDVSSVESDSGLKYRFGLHKSGGQPEAFNSASSDIPLALLPGVCAKAAFSYKMSMDLWRKKMKRRKRIPFTRTQKLLSYDVFLKDPHAAISGIVGGTCSAWFGGDGTKNVSVESQQDVSDAGRSVILGPKRKNQFTADMFGSLLYTHQHGRFMRNFNDLTRLDARLDIYSASSFLKGVGHLMRDIVKGRVDREVNPLALPRLNLILQQQVAGPIVFRVDSRVSLGSPSGKKSPYVEDVMFGLSYSFKMLQSGKLLAWFSPKRKEAMIELRIMEL